MTDKTQAKAAGRRDFLKLAGLGTLAGAAVAVTAPAEQAEAAEAERAGGGYRETEHVKKAYELARF